MARQRVVTRSIEDCIVEVTAMVTIDGKKTLAEETLHLGGQVSEEKALTVAQKMHNTDTFKVVEVNKFYKKMTIYGMKETDFIKLAQPMDDDRHFLNGEEVETEDGETEDEENVTAYMNKDGSVTVERKKK